MGWLVFYSEQQSAPVIIFAGLALLNYCPIPHVSRLVSHVLRSRSSEDLIAVEGAKLFHTGNQEPRKLPQKLSRLARNQLQHYLYLLEQGTTSATGRRVYTSFRANAIQEFQQDSPGPKTIRHWTTLMRSPLQKWCLFGK